MQKILVIEDDIDIQDILKNHLIDAGYEVVSAHDGVDGISNFNEDISLVLLDIMLTALSDEEHQLRGFEQKIDNYVPKPFSPKILLCKIAAILRRGASESDDKHIITYKDLRMDIDGFHLYHDEQEILLTQKEFELLRLLLENQGRVFTRQMLLDRLWGIDVYVEDRIVDSHIKNLRKKLNVNYIETIRGMGYRIDKCN